AITSAATPPMRVAPMMTAGANQRGGRPRSRFIVDSNPGHGGQSAPTWRPKLFRLAWRIRPYGFGGALVGCAFANARGVEIACLGVANSEKPLVPCSSIAEVIKGTSAMEL